MKIRMAILIYIELLLNEWLSEMCAIAQVRCFKNGKTPIVLYLPYLKIYHFVDVIHRLKKNKNLTEKI